MGISVITPTQMREWEQATWAAGQTPAEVIHRAGQAIARRARAITRPGDTILFLAGKGHNGDDTRAAYKQTEDRRAELLEIMGREPDLAALQSKLREKPTLIVDGLFGLGLDRPLNEIWQGIIQTINAARRRVLAVDLPSGLNPETGESFGAVIQATLTVTLGAPKTGLFTPAGSVPTGRLEVAADIGLIPCPFTSALQVVTPGEFADWPPTRPVDGHKGTFGHLAILAGSLGYHGAAVLAARGAMRAQPGLVTVFTANDVYFPVAAQLQSAMVNPWPPNLALPEKATGILVGPGLAAATVTSEMRQAVRRLWRVDTRPMVLDASGLPMVVTGEPTPRPTPRVVTPHPGEAATMLKTSIANILADRVGALREISRRYDNCWVVLKGHQTLMGRAEGAILVNLSGNPHMAQGGSGDVLAGYLAALLAQPVLAEDPARTIAYAVWQHGAAADRLQEVRSNWTIEDLAEEIGGTGEE